MQRTNVSDTSLSSVQCHDIQTPNKCEEPEEQEIELASNAANTPEIGGSITFEPGVERISSLCESDSSVPNKKKHGPLIITSLDHSKVFNHDICSRTMMASSSQNGNKVTIALLQSHIEAQQPLFPSELQLAFNELSAEVKESQMITNHLLSKVMTIEEFVKNASLFTQKTPVLVKEDTIFEATLNGYTFTFPITSRTMFTELNAQLSEKSNFLSIVETLSILHKGSCMQQCVRRLAASVFAINFATEINWIGAHGKLALAHTNIASAIINAVRSSRNYPNETIGSVVRCIQRWLHCASDRNGGRTARRKIAYKRAIISSESYR